MSKLHNTQPEYQTKTLENKPNDKDFDILSNIKPRIFHSHLNLSSYFNDFDKKKTIYPVKDLTELKKIEQENNEMAKLLSDSKFYKNNTNNINNIKTINIDNYINKTNLVCNYVFDQKYNITYTPDQIKFRNDVIFNMDDERFDDNDEYDPWLFNRYSNQIWPDYVKNVYYTKLTPNGKIARLSYLTNLFLNKAYETQNFVPFIRLFYHPIYVLASKLCRKPIIKDIKDEYITEKYITDFGNIEILHRDKNIIQRDFDRNPKKMIKVPVDEPQPSYYAYKNFFDYVPICFLPPKHNEVSGNEYDNPRNLIMSNICFHKHNCHDYWCTTHNKTNKQSYINKHTHDDNQVYYEFKPEQIIDIKKFLSEHI